MSKKNPVVGVIMGSESDLRVMNDAEKILASFDVPFETKIVSAHRTPRWMQDYATTASEKGLKILIAGAGGAAHLPGMVASLTHLPVIGVPILVGPLKGIDALLSIVQMPRGIPVATVAVDNSYNAALLAIRILSNSDETLKKKMIDFLKAQEKKVILANRKLRNKR